LEAAGVLGKPVIWAGGGERRISKRGKRKKGEKANEASAKNIRPHRKGREHVGMGVMGLWDEAFEKNNGRHQKELLETGVRTVQRKRATLPKKKKKGI